MNKILSSLLIAAALSSSVVFAEDVLHTTMVDGKRRVDFTFLAGGDSDLVRDAEAGEFAHALYYPSTAVRRGSSLSGSGNRHGDGDQQ